MRKEEIAGGRHCTLTQSSETLNKKSVNHISIVLDDFILQEIIELRKNLESYTHNAHSSVSIKTLIV